MYLFCRDNVASPHTCHKPRARLRCSEIQIGQPASVSIARLNPHPSNTTTTENPTDMEFTMTWNRVTRKRGEKRTDSREVLLVRSVLTRVQYSTCAACFGGFSSQVGRTCETNFREDHNRPTIGGYHQFIPEKDWTDGTYRNPRVIHRWQLFGAKFLSTTYISYVIFVSSSYFCLENKRLCSWSFSLKVTSSFLKIDK